MTEKDERSLDILGIKPIGDAVNTVVKGTVDGVAAFLSRICLPAAEELGLLFRDKVSHWRSMNVVKVAEKAERKLIENSAATNIHAHPRLVSLTLEHSSWTDDDEVQEMWAGLLASSCTEDGKDESNLIFINILSQLTTAQSKILKYACENAKKRVSTAGWILAEQLDVSLEEIQTISGVEDFQRLDRELDHLRALDLIHQVSGGFYMESTNANITPSSLALHLYVRCQGSTQSPVVYFALIKNG